MDESGNQIAVFGRRGARPFNREEASRLYMHDGKPTPSPTIRPPLPAQTPAAQIPPATRHRQRVRTKRNRKRTTMGETSEGEFQVEADTVADIPAADKVPRELVH